MQTLNKLESAGFTLPENYESIKHKNEVEAYAKLMVNATTEIFSHKKCPFESVEFERVCEIDPNTIMEYCLEKDMRAYDMMISSDKVGLLMHCRPITGGTGTQSYWSKQIELKDGQRVIDWVNEWFAAHTDRTEAKQMVAESCREDADIQREYKTEE